MIHGYMQLGQWLGVVELGIGRTLAAAICLERIEVSASHHEPLPFFHMIDLLFSVSSLIHCLWKTVCTSFPPWRPRFSKPRFRPLCRVPPAQAGVRVGGMSQSQDEPAPRQYSLEQGFVAKVVFDIGRACSKTMACSELCDHAVEKRGQMGQPSESLTKSKKLGH